MVLLNDTSPMIRHRVLYIGSASPTDTATGLDAIQSPLKERYPTDQEDGIEGIDAYLSVTSSYLQLQYVSDPDQIIQFPVSTLSLCAAVRCVRTINGASGEANVKFVSLNDPLAGGENLDRPAIFTAITRRTQGRKVLECHGFICHSPHDALELVKITSLAGKNYKKNGSVKTPRPVAQRQVVQQTQSNGSAFHERSFTFGAETLNNRNSGISNASVPNGSLNGFDGPNQPSMRLIPGEPVTIKPGPEFFEPVSKQGYFYSSDKSEVKKFNIAKLQKPKEDKENNSEFEPLPTDQPITTPRSVINGYGEPHVYVPPQMNGGFRPTLLNRYGPRPHARAAPSYGPHPPIYIRMQREPPQPQPHPFMYGHPPPPHPMMYPRPRFFSPPPPRFRPQPFMVPPGAPPPMMAPPIYVRRPRSRSGSRSISAGSRGTRTSRSKSPKEETEPKRVPTGDADSSSDDTVTLRPMTRPITPPKDYPKPKSKGQRRSRRDDYEIGQQPYRAGYHPPPPIMQAPYPYDYYVYPPHHGGYAPFTMYNPHGRSRSLPPDPRLRSASPKKGKGKNKKAKKNKKKKVNRRNEPKAYPGTHSDVSTDSYGGGYHSEIPRQRPATTEPDTGYQLYRPRDFRRDEKQFMNERSFGKSIIEETRRSRDSKAYPTAYELNQDMDRSRRDDGDLEPDFNMY